MRVQVARKARETALRTKARAKAKTATTARAPKAIKAPKAKSSSLGERAILHSCHRDTSSTFVSAGFDSSRWP